MENPFKFGSIVENEFFTDRVKEVEYICNYLNSRKLLVGVKINDKNIEYYEGDKND